MLCNCYQGNTPLLLAYMNGQGAMCRVLVRAGACLAQENKDGISIFNYQVSLSIAPVRYPLSSLRKLVVNQLSK